MKITHVGSLPFTDEKEAMDYTLRFDIPALFTLPMKNKNEFMLNEYQSLKRNLKISRKEDFFKRLKCDSFFKYQLLGPISASILLEKKIDFNDAFKFYKSVISEFSRRDHLLFIFDEPLLDKACTLEIQGLIKLIDSLKEGSIKIGIHCCAKLDKEYLKLLSQNLLNIDISLYSKEELSHYNWSFPGVNETANLDMLYENSNKMCYLSPACGLALNNVKETSRIFRYLKKIKDNIRT